MTASRSCHPTYSSFPIWPGEAFSCRVSTADRAVTCPETQKRKLNVDNKGHLPWLSGLNSPLRSRGGDGKVILFYFFIFIKVITASRHRDPSARLPRRLDRPVCTCRRERPWVHYPGSLIVLRHQSDTLWGLVSFPMSHLCFEIFAQCLYERVQLILSEYMSLWLVSLLQL